MTGALIAGVVLALATAFGLLRRRRDGVLRPTRAAGASEKEGGEVDDGLGTGLAAADLGGAELGERATLVQFSSAFCAPCRATRLVLGEVAEMVDGVSHVEIDAEEHLDLVRRLNVIRTPTVLVLDDAGRIIRRAAGLPRKADVIAALGEAIA